MSVNSTITNLFWAVIPPVKWWSRIPRLTLRIPCSVYQILFQWNLKTEFQSLVCFRIPWAAGIPDSKEQDSGFHNKKLPDSGNRIPNTCSELVSQFSSSFFLLLPKGHQCLWHQVPVLFYVVTMIAFQNLTYRFLYPQISGYNTLFTLQVNCNAPQMPFCCVIHLDSVSFNSLDSTQLDRSR